MIECLIILETVGNPAELDAYTTRIKDFIKRKQIQASGPVRKPNQRIFKCIGSDRIHASLEEIRATLPKTITIQTHTEGWIRTPAEQILAPLVPDQVDRLHAINVSPSPENHLIIRTGKIKAKRNFDETFIYCPECGSSNVKTSPFGRVCNSCGVIQPESIVPQLKSR